MRSFNLTLDNRTSEEFYRMFPEYGQRTAVLRRLVKALIKRGKLDLDDDASIINTVYNQMKGEKT
jgi:hypothetical protein